MPQTKKKATELSPERKARMRKNMRMITTPAAGLKKLALKKIKQKLATRVPSKIKVSGQKKTVKIRNTGRATQAPLRRRRAKFKVTRR